MVDIASDIFVEKINPIVQYYAHNHDVKDTF